jgi:hypothetical protein
MFDEVNFWHRALGYHPRMGVAIQAIQSLRFFGVVML